VQNVLRHATNPPLSRPASKPTGVSGVGLVRRGKLRGSVELAIQPRYGGSHGRCVRGPRSRRSVLVRLQWNQLVGRTIAGTLSSARATLRARKKNCVQVGVPLNDGKRSKI